LPGSASAGAALPPGAGPGARPKSPHLLKGQLLFGRPVIRVDCLVRKLTAAGADVILISGLQLPRRVFLFLEGEDILHEATLVQSQGWLSRLSFLSAAPEVGKRVKR
jgi:hypothetical protein